MYYAFHLNVWQSYDRYNYPVHVYNKVQTVFEYGNIKMQQPVTRYGERDIRRFLPGFWTMEPPNSTTFFSISGLLSDVGPLITQNSFPSKILDV